MGKGIGNRLFAHLNSAVASPLESHKLDKIRSIQSKGFPVKRSIIRHGLTEKESFEVQAALIDFIDIRELTNVVFITGNGLFRRNMNDHGLYEITRGNCVVAERRNKAKVDF